MRNHKVPVSINPFKLIHEEGEPVVDRDTLICRLCEFQGLPDTVVERIASLHKEVGKLAHEPFVVPHDHGDLSIKLVTPLRSAKITLILGHFLATISLCGTACEMLALFLIRDLDLRIRDEAIDEQRQTTLFGSTPEKLSQARRVAILYALGVINKETRDDLDAVRKVRNKYIHLDFDKDTDARADAVIAYVKSIELLNSFISLSFVRGKMQMNPALLAHLRKQGVIEDYEELPS